MGALDGVNTVFTLPRSEVAHHASPGHRIRLYFNGLRVPESRWSASESGGAGTGFDTVDVAGYLVPRSGDCLYVDYVQL
ncbi:MAG: hypothetical protein B7733_06085 [Myxococcales bacterium FL481]|nr:MAG: hypothetical protein B7733_06085 [Myxococcales bacterium FL481]